MPAGCLACGFSRGAATVAALALRRGDAPSRIGGRRKPGRSPRTDRGLPRCGGARRAYGRGMPTEEDEQALQKLWPRQRRPLARARCAITNKRRRLR